MGLRRRRSAKRSLQLESLEDRCLLSTITVTSLADNMDVDGEVTLREAIEAANTNAPVDGSNAGQSSTDSIVFDPSLAGGTIQLELGQIRINGTTTIVGDEVVIDAQSESRIFKISRDANRVTLANLHLTNGFHPTAGGAIQSSSTGLKILDSTLSNNVVRGDSNRLMGGAIYAVQANLDNVVLEGNSVEFTGTGDASTSVSGGAVHVRDADVRDSILRNNVSDGAGGGLTATETLELRDSEVSQNEAPLAGAGVFFNQAQDLYDESDSTRLSLGFLDGSSVIGNRGVGFSINTAFWVNIVESEFADNSSHGIEVLESRFSERVISLLQSDVSRNGGSGLKFDKAGPDIFDSTVADNQLHGIEGAVSAYVEVSTISGNGLTGATLHAPAPGVYSQGFWFTNTTISGHSVGQGPAAIDVLVGNDPRSDAGTVYLENSTVANNISGSGWGPIGSSNAVGDLVNRGLIVSYTSVIALNSDINGTPLDLGCWSGHFGMCEIHDSVIGAFESDLLEEFLATSDAESNEIGTSDAPLDPKIGALFQHGLSTPTHALLPDSPAIGKGDAVDSRRNRGSSISDAGAMGIVDPVSELLGLTVPDANALEATGELVFDIWASSLPTSGTATATFAVVEGSAVEGRDFVGIDPITITFDANSDIRQQLVIPLSSDDNLVEDDKTLQLELIDATGFDVLPDTPAVGTIRNDDVVTVSLTAASRTTVTERDGGSRRVKFKVQAENALNEPFEVRFQTIDKTASAEFGDYEPIDTILSFSGRAGQSQTVTVDVFGDDTVEIDERFEVQISLHDTSASIPNLELGDASDFVNIVNDETGVGFDGTRVAVIGTDADEQMGVSDNGNGLQVSLDNHYLSLQPGEANEVVILAHGGADYVRVSGTELTATVLVESGDGDDAVELIRATATVRTQAGNDVVETYGEGNVTILGGIGDDTINGGSGNDLLDGGAGNDLIRGGTGHISGNDEVFGGAGADRIEAGDGDDSIEAGAGNDSVYAEDGSDSVNGGEGEDFLSGGDGNDTLNGGSDFDTAYGGSGDDIVYANVSYGGAGDDVLNYAGDHRDEPNLGGRLVGGSGDDRISGSSYDDFISGGNGDDTIEGNFGDDRIFGDAGNDELYGQRSWSSVSPGQYGLTDNDTIEGGSGRDTILGNFGHDDLTGGAGPDQIFGGAGHDELRGGSGSDLLQGEGGQDLLLGGNDEDVLFGGSGADTLDGGSGSDLVSASEDSRDAEDIYNTWLSEETYASRVNAVVALNAELESDNFADEFLPDAGRDLFFANLTTDILSADFNEVIEEL